MKDKDLTVGDYITDTITIDAANMPSIDADYITTCDMNLTISIDSLNIVYTDPYAQLEEFEQEKEEDEQLRNEYPELQELYEEYQMVKILVKDYNKK